MHIHLSKILTVWLGVFVVSGCGAGDGPDVPEAAGDLYGGNQGTGDLESGDTSDSEDLSPTDSLGDTRLASLPPDLSSKVEECEDKGRFFNIGKTLCTEQKPTDYPCRIDQDFRQRLDISTLGPLEDYLKAKGNNQQLYACTENEESITLHFFNYKKGRITYKELTIARAPPPR